MPGVGEHREQQHAVIPDRGQLAVPDPRRTALHEVRLEIVEQDPMQRPLEEIDLVVNLDERGNVLFEEIVLRPDQATQRRQRHVKQRQARPHVERTARETREAMREVSPTKDPRGFATRLRDRLSDISAGPGAVFLTVGCECYAKAFELRPGRLVLDILDGVDPAAPAAEQAQTAGPMADVPTEAEARPAMRASAAMAEVLRRQATDFAVSNVSVFEAKWEEAEVEPADIVLCAHVLYVVADVETFVRKMESHARERVLVVLYQAPPQSGIYTLWELVHGEKRIPLPALPEFQEVLAQLGINARVEMLAQQPARGFENQEQALAQLADRLYLAPATPQMNKLEKVLPDLLEVAGDSLIIKGSQPMEPALVSWQPGG